MIAGFALVQTSPASAQAMRTYVSGTGADGNACTFAAPCRTLQAALARTAAGGELQTLDSADYGYVTITQAATIIGAHGATGVLASNVSGITVNAGSSDVVTLRGLEIDGAGSGVNGIVVNSGGTLNVADSVIRGFATGINIKSSTPTGFAVTNTVISNMSVGLAMQSTAASTGVLNNAQVVNNATGVTATGASTSSVATLTIQNSVVANNPTMGIMSNGYSQVIVSNTTLANNGVGAEAQSATAYLQLTNSTVTGNATGWTTVNGGQVNSSGGNSIGGNVAGNGAPPSTSTPPPPNYVAKNIITDFGATCNGAADDSSAFMAFNAWARVQTLQVQLTIPSGVTCEILSDTAQFWAAGIQNLLVLGYGATLSNNNSASTPFQLAGRGQYNDNLHSARLATVAAGSSCVTLLNPGQSTLYSVGNYALITGLDLQGQWQAGGYGYPSNPHYFEYVLVSGINAATGQICFSAPLKNTYKSTWPLYDPGGPFGVDEGGPATLYALNPTWNVQVEYRGLTIDQTQFQTYANGRSVTYRDVTFTGGACAVPSQNLVWQAINVSMTWCSMEVDKLVGTVSMSGVTIYEIGFQSSSTDLFQMTSSTVTHKIEGTPKKAVISDSTIGSLDPGAYAYGRSDETTCTNCIITALVPRGIYDNGPSGSGVNNSYTMSNGVITVPNANGAVRWAVPGTNFMWTSHYENELMAHVIDVTQDANNTYIQTSWAGGFPNPINTTVLSIRVHPAPKFTCSGCSGTFGSVAAQWPAAVPLYSYQTYSYNGSSGTTQQPMFELWGNLSSVRLNVTTAYNASQTFHASLFDNWPVINSLGAAVSYGPSVNTQIVGDRSVTLSSVTGAQIGDNGLAAPDSVTTWFTGPSDSGPDFSSNANPSCPGANCPSVTITLQTDQGLVVQ